MQSGGDPGTEQQLIDCVTVVCFVAMQFANVPDIK